MSVTLHKHSGQTVGATVFVPGIDTLVGDAFAGSWQR